MQCVSEHPCLKNKLNLNMMLTLKKKCNCDIKCSGHEGSVSPSILALSRATSLIERQ